ncbi:MAG: hypothetical protein LBC87_01640 [Fibromonadaceae bacterium]|jgi:hypothetical protein|nr:hypothetical protein [Fibromonadaceae bacterium]
MNFKTTTQKLNDVKCQLERLYFLFKRYKELETRCVYEKTKEQEIAILRYVLMSLRLYKDELLSELNGTDLSRSILSCLNPKFTGKADSSIIKDYSQ